MVLLSGRPLVITKALPFADAFVAAWLPGTEGEGITDVLFGDVPFTGKTPYTWPRSSAQLPFDFKTLPTTGCDAPLVPVRLRLDDERPITRDARLSAKLMQTSQPCTLPALMHDLQSPISTLYSPRGTHQ